jgi:hypothetical protein
VTGRRRLARAGCAALLLALADCSFEIGEFATASTRKIPTELREIGITEGRHCARVLMGVPLGRIVPSLELAVRDALARQPGADTLIDLEVNRQDSYLVLYQQTCLAVKGMAASTVVDRAEAPQAAADRPAAPAPVRGAGR